VISARIERGLAKVVIPAKAGIQFALAA